jgi:hypothetical protein
VAIGELAGELREGSLALADGTRLQVLAALMEDDVTAGPKGRHEPELTDPARPRAGLGHLGGRRVPVQSPPTRRTRSPSSEATGTVPGCTDRLASPNAGRGESCVTQRTERGGMDTENWRAVVCGEPRITYEVAHKIT